MNLKGTIKRIVTYAVFVTEPEEIILFGSMANGGVNVYSDIDLLIISNSEISKKEASMRIKNYCHQFSLKSDALIFSNLEFEKEMNTPNSFVKAVQKSGKIIYKKKRI